MKKWLETCDVFQRLAVLTRADMPAALATVVRVVGSAYRHEGAKLLVAAEGTTVGNVSGGCLEQDVIEVARRVLRTGEPELRTYCSGQDAITAWDLGLGCAGQVQVYIESARDALLARRCLDNDAPFVLCTAIHGGRVTVTETAADGDLGSSELNRIVITRARSLLGSDHAGLETFFGGTWCFDAFEPRPVLIVCGAGADAPALVRIASSVGFRVIVSDRRPGHLAAERFPGASRLIAADAESLTGQVAIGPETCAVVMTHNFADDAGYLAALLSTPARYIGMLGPRERTERMLQALGVTGSVEESRVYGPVGLDIGTDGAEQVALSVVAEILAVRSGRPARSLRDRALSIHAW